MTGRGCSVDGCERGHRACDDRIHRGDDITASPDGWQHRDCGAPDTPTNPCPTCWLVGPCDCEDAL